MRLVSVVTSTRSLRRRAVANLREQIVDLALDRTHFDRRIHQPGRANHLLDDDAAGLVQLVRARRRRDVDQLRHARFPLLEVERPVVERRRQAEAVVDEHFLARAIADVHAADLRHRLMALVDDDERVRRAGSRAASAAARPAGGRSDAASSSRCRGSSRSRGSSRGRTSSADAAAALRAACPRARAAPRRSTSSALIVSTASFRRSRDVTKCDFGIDRDPVVTLRNDLPGQRIER